MELTREERMQQRLRGAQRRQVKDVDFGLVFPAASAPVPPMPPTRRTPQPELPPQPSTRRTPANATSLTESIRPIAQSANDANTSAKRRKLDSDIQPLLSGRSTRSSRATPRPDIYALNDDDQQEQSAVESTNPSIEQVFEPAIEQDSATPSSPLRIARTPSISVQIAEDINESQTDGPGSNYMIRVGPADVKSSGVQEIHNASSARSATEVETLMPTRKRKRGTAPKAATVETSRKRRSQTNQEIADEVDELSPEQSTRRVRRPKVAVQDDQPTGEHDPLSDPAEQEEAEAIDDEEAATLLKKFRGRRKSRIIIEMSPDLDKVEDEDLPLAKKQRKRQREESSRAQQRQPPKSNSNTQTSKKQANKKTPSSGSPIPVTVHRLTRAPLYDEDELDAAVLNAEIPHMKRGGVNAVDVLSQICQEIVGAALYTLEEGGNSCEDAALRREYKTKWHAVESFGNEVHARLLEHTINLDNTYSLERRVRDEQKKKLGLRGEILHVRTEREKVALRMDEIRIRHEREMTSARERDYLNIAMYDIELAIETGKTRKTNQSADQTADLSGIDLLLKRVAGEASNKGDSGGMLRQIKEFNAFLERAALVLESRRA